MSSASWPRSNEQGSPPAPEAGNRLADGRHLGCSRSRSSSRRSGRRDPGWNRRRSAPNGASWQCRTLQPARPRFHDERCPSGSGWEKTLLRSPARTTPEERRPSNEGRSWPVKTRLASVPADAATRIGTGTASSREALVARAGVVCEPRESGAGERSARAHARAVRDGDQAVVRACSRIVVVAEVDERRLVQTERSGV